VKFQFLEGKKFNGSLDMAVSLFSVEWGINDTTDHKNSVLGLYPSLILGTKDIYFGPKLVYLIGTGDVGDYIDTQHRLPYKKPFLGFFTGLKLKLGKKLRLIPEVTLYYTPDYGVWFHGGIALSSD
jgi:hypothetical protein